MPWITIGTPPFDSIEKMDEVFAQVGALPDGSQARYAGKADDGTLRIVTIWETGPTPIGSSPRRSARRSPR